MYGYAGAAWYDCNESTKAFCAQVQLETITNRVYPSEYYLKS